MKLIIHILLLLLTSSQVANLRKTFANYLSADIKLSKTQLTNMIQSGRFLGKLLGPLLKTGLSLIKNDINPLAKNDDIVFEYFLINA